MRGGYQKIPARWIYRWLCGCGSELELPYDSVEADLPCVTCEASLEIVDMEPSPKGTLDVWDESLFG